MRLFALLVLGFAGRGDADRHDLDGGMTTFTAETSVVLVQEP